jgi:hypothetical protein
MADPNETISVSEFATALGLDPKASKTSVLNALAVLRVSAGASPRRRKLSKVFESVAEFDELKKRKIKVRVAAPHPLHERGETYYPAVLDPNGREKKPGDVFVTDEARLRKLGKMVEVVDPSTPTTVELKEREAIEKARKTA